MPLAQRKVNGHLLVRDGAVAVRVNLVEEAGRRLLVAGKKRRQSIKLSTALAP